MTNQGWIKLHRAIKDHWLWQDPKKFRAFFDLVIMANHKDSKVIRGNQLIKVKRGQVFTSQLALAEGWGWNRKTVVRFLSVLEMDEMLGIETSKGTDTGYTILTIRNYNKFQDSDNSKRDIQNQDGTDIEGTSRGHPGDISKKNKEWKEGDLLFSSSSSENIDSSNPLLSSSSVSEKRNEPCEQIFSLWNSKPNLKHHRSLNGQERHIKAALKDWSLEEIKTAINRYSEVRSNPKRFRPVYRWTLGDFLTRKNGYNVERFNLDDWQEEFSPGEQSTEDYLEALRREH